MIRLYQTPLAACEDLKANASKSHAAQDNMTSSDMWHGAHFETLERMAQTGGDDTNIPAAMALLATLEMAFPETERAQWLPSVAGAFPCVPDALMGFPEPMRAKSFVESNAAPIKVGVFTTISGNISHKQFQKRAIATLAIIMHLANSGRAVELWGVNAGYGSDKSGESVIATRIDTAPLSVSQAGLVLANIGFTRRVGYGLMYAHNGFNGQWPTGFDTPSGVAYSAKLAKRMSFNAILPALHGDEARELDADPVKWMLTRYAEIQEILGMDIAA